eukprot:gb/GECG01014502.1/.p1 GENE.gb/GECG01014502.1/~~gb/GECG01014502.1/.p1  ORF type:complete len:577 (+),score=44.53 gb/GECG01014502.1/:1-1731(+)
MAAGGVVSAELVFYLSIVSILTNLSRVDPISQWLMKGLPFYVAPDQNSLQALLDYYNQVTSRKKDKKKKGDQQTEQSAPPPPVSATSPEQLVDTFSARIHSGLRSTFNWNNIHLYSDYDILLFILLSGFALFMFAETWSCIRGTYPQEMSMIAVTLTVTFGIKALGSTLWTLGLSRGETQFSLFVGFAGFVASLLFFQASSNVFEFQLAPGLSDAAERTENMLKNKMHVHTNIKPWMMGFQMLIALIAATVTTVTVLAALRWSTFYVYTRRDSTAGIGKRILTRLNFLMPIFSILLWIKPIGRQFQANDLAPCTEGASLHDCTRVTDLSNTWIMNDTQFLRFRVWMVLLTLSMRLLQFLPLMRSFLRTGREDLLEAIRDHLREGSKASDVKTLHSRLTATSGRVIRSMCVVAIQFFAPISMTFGFVALLVRKGGVDLGLCTLYENVLDQTQHLTGVTANSLRPHFEEKFTLFQRMMDQAMNYVLDISSLQRDQFSSPELWRPTFSFLVWWSLVVWSITVALGIFYYETVFGVAGITRATKQEEADAATANGAENAGPVGPTHRRGRKQRKEDKKSQ